MVASLAVFVLSAFFHEVIVFIVDLHFIVLFISLCLLDPSLQPLNYCF